MNRDEASKQFQDGTREARQPLTLSLTETTWQWLQRQARACNLSPSEWLEEYARCAASGATHHPIVQEGDRSPPVNTHPNGPSALSCLEDRCTEQQLRRYQLLSENSRDIVIYLNLEGRILEANYAAVKAYGYDREELLTLTIADLRAPSTHSVLAEQLQRAAEQGILFETLHLRKDGSTFPVEISAQSASIDDQVVVLSIIRDISERKQAEAEREQLLRREQVARSVAEAAEWRASFLVEASAVLNSSLDYQYTLKSVAQLAVPALADWCSVDILKPDGALDRLAIAHTDPAKVSWGTELHRRYPPNLQASEGLAKVLRTGKSAYYSDISDEQIVAAAQDPEHLQLLRQVGLRSALIVPLMARGRTLGAMSFVTTDESGHRYSVDELALAEELACRAAIALDNAELYQQAQQAQQRAEQAADRTARLQAVTAALSQSLTPLQVADVIVEQSMSALGADASLMVLLTADGTELEIVQAVGYAPDLVESWRRFSISANAPLAEVVRTGQPIWAESVADRMLRHPQFSEVYQRYSYEGWMALPLQLESQPVGGILLSFKQFKALTQDDRDFILALTRQCAQAIVRAQLYAAEQRARAEAETANRIKDEFLAVLSHELRSPLNPILGWTNLLRNRQFDAATTQRALETIERNARLQSQLIEDLLDVSRILQGKFRLDTVRVNLVTVIEQALETVRLAAEVKAIQIQTNLAQIPVLVMGDATRLQQVVWNLLSNAVKFTPRGGRITVTLTLVMQAEAALIAGGCAGSGTQVAAPFVQLTVSDTGKGIAPEFLPHVFDYFRQADASTTRQFGGLGLGLAIVRHITELHGGLVEADSRGEGQGATFTVKLPLVTMSATPQNEGPPIGPERSLAGIRVLAVDDEADMRELTQCILEQVGAEVQTAASAQQAVSLLAQAIPDILLCDIGMPYIDGYELMQHIRSLPPEQGGRVPAIALTAYAGDFDRQQALRAGFQQHISKPIDPPSLVRAIRELLQQ